jgi:hypothetical protein
MQRKSRLPFDSTVAAIASSLGGTAEGIVKDTQCRAISTAISACSVQMKSTRSSDTPIRTPNASVVLRTTFSLRSRAKNCLSVMTHMAISASVRRAASKFVQCWKPPIPVALAVTDSQSALMGPDLSRVSFFVPRGSALRG